MNLLKLGPVLERFVDATSGLAVQVDNDACVHHWNHASDCRLCIDGCPVQAITLATATEIALEQERCVQCGYCLHACPTAVFTAGIDETARLLQAAAVLSPCSALDLTCRHLPANQAEATAIIEVGSCLAALGVSAYIGLAALGVEQAGVRVEACGECPIGSLRSQIEGTAAAARALTTISITLIEHPPGAAEKKPVYSTRAPLVSRRSLWRRFGGPAPASALPPQEKPPAEGKHPPLERRTLLHGLAHLPDAQRASGPFFPALAASASCTACGVCATVCPTGALTLVDAENTFTLEFAPLTCTDCGLCLQLCPPQALQPEQPIAYSDACPAVLLAGERKQCRRCRASFAGAGDLCPVCTFRRYNPAGSMMRFPSTAS